MHTSAFAWQRTRLSPLKRGKKRKPMVSFSIGYIHWTSCPKPSLCGYSGNMKIEITWLTDVIFSHLSEMPATIAYHQKKKEDCKSPPSIYCADECMTPGQQSLFNIQIVGHPRDFCKLQTLKQATFPPTETSRQPHMGWLLACCLSLGKYNENGDFCMCCTSGSCLHLLSLKPAREIMHWCPMTRSRL